MTDKTPIIRTEQKIRTQIHAENAEFVDFQRRSASSSVKLRPNRDLSVNQVGEG